MTMAETLWEVAEQRNQRIREKRTKKMVDTKKIREENRFDPLDFPKFTIYDLCDEVDRFQELLETLGKSLENYEKENQRLRRISGDVKKRNQNQFRKLMQLEDEIQQLRKLLQLPTNVGRIIDEQEKEIATLKGACTHLVPRQKLTEAIKDFLASSIGEYRVTFNGIPWPDTRELQLVLEEHGIK